MATTFEYLDDKMHSNLGVNLNRQKYAPLDGSSVFTSTTDLEYYIKKGAYDQKMLDDPPSKAGVATYVAEYMTTYPYVGQIVTIVANNEVKTYKITDVSCCLYEQIDKNEIDPSRIQKAAKDKYGVVKIGDGIDVADGVIAVTTLSGQLSNEIIAAKADATQKVADLSTSLSTTIDAQAEALKSTYLPNNYLSVGVANAPTAEDKLLKSSEVDAKITTAIEGLDAAISTLTTAESLKSIEEVDGKIRIEKQSIQIDKSQVNDLTSDLNTINTKIGGLQTISADHETRLTVIEGDYLKQAQYNVLSAGISANYNALTVLNGDDTVDGSVAKSIKTAIEALDVDKVDVAAYEAVKSIQQTDGKIAVEKQAIQLSGLDQVTGLTDAIATAKTEAIDSAKTYTDGISAALSTDYVAKANAAQAAGELSAQAVRNDLTGYVLYTDIKGGSAALSGDNKIATLADVVGLSGSVHILGTIENEEERSLSTDQQVIVATYPNAKRGAIVINTKNAKEYVCMAAIGVKAVAADWLELGDEGLYETKADAAAKLVAAKAYTDEQISALDVTDTAVDHQFVTKVDEVDGKIAVTRAALVIGDIPTLTSLYDDKGAAATAETNAKNYTNSVSTALSTDYVEKIGTARSDLCAYADQAEADAIATAKSYTDGVSAALSTDYVEKIGTAESNAKAYTDALSNTMDGKIDLKLDASAVVGKVALSTLAEVDTALTGFVRDVYVNGTTVVDANKIAQLGVLAGKNSISTDLLDDASVTTAKIVDSAVTTAKVADSAITTAKIADAAVTHAKLADQSVAENNLSGMFIWDCGGAQDPA